MPVQEIRELELKLVKIKKENNKAYIHLKNIIEIIYANIKKDC